MLSGRTSHNTTVSEIMSSTVFTIHPDQTVEEAMEMMNNRRIRHLPVVSDDKEHNLLGVISQRDVMKAIIYKQREAIKSMEDRMTS